MQLNPSEISELIKAKIEKFDLTSEAHNEGTVVSVTDGIVRIHGLADARYGEMLEFPQNTFGMALNLEQDSVGAVVLGDYKHISEGDTVKTTGRILEVPIGDALLGLRLLPLLLLLALPLLVLEGGDLLFEFLDLLLQGAEESAPAISKALKSPKANKPLPAFLKLRIASPSFTSIVS